MGSTGSSAAGAVKAAGQNSTNNTKSRVDTYNKRLLTEGRFAEDLNRNGIVSVPMDYYAGTNSDFMRMADSMGYATRYDREDDAVIIRKRRS